MGWRWTSFRPCLDVIFNADEGLSSAECAGHSPSVLWDRNTPVPRTSSHACAVARPTVTLSRFYPTLTLLAGLSISLSACLSTFSGKGMLVPPPASVCVPWVCPVDPVHLPPAPPSLLCHCHWPVLICTFVRMPVRPVFRPGHARAPHHLHVRPWEGGNPRLAAH